MNSMNWPKTLIIFSSIVIAGYFIGNMHKTGKKFDRYVQVKGLSEREVNADIAVWPMNITVTGNDLKLLMAEIDKQNNQVYNFFIQQGFNAKDITKGNASIRDAKANMYGNSSENIEFRYLATAELTIRTSDIQKLQKAYSESSELISKGILLGSKNSWRPVEYHYTGLNQLKPSMIEEATKNAREVAEKFARDSDSRVGKIRKARQGVFSINDKDQNTPETKVVRVVSTIDFQLED